MPLVLALAVLLGGPGLDPRPAVPAAVPVRPAPERPAMGVPPAPGTGPLPATAPSGGLRGLATWYSAPSGTAAAGPALRSALGRSWRGSVVRVCSGARCVRVRLTDWMRADRLVDLNAGSFRAVCGPLSRGVCRVEVSRA